MIRPGKTLTNCPNHSFKAQVKHLRVICLNVIFSQNIDRENWLEKTSQIAKQDGPKNNDINKSPASSGRRTTDSYRSSISGGRPTVNKSQQNSSVCGENSISLSFSSGESFRFRHGDQSLSNSKPSNRDDTSPLGGPSTSDDINIVISPSKVDKVPYNDRTSVRDQIHQLNLKQNTSNFRQSPSQSSLRSTSNTSTSGSFSIQEDFSNRVSRKEIENSVENSSSNQENIGAAKLGSSSNQKLSTRREQAEGYEGRYASVDYLTNTTEQRNFQLREFNQLFSEEESLKLSTSKSIDIGTLVELFSKDKQYYGVIKWIGRYPKSQLFVKESHKAKEELEKETMIAGIELEDEIEGGLNGWYHGSQLFDCADGRGVFLPFTHFQPDRRFEASISQFPTSNGATNDTNHDNASSSLTSFPSAPPCFDNLNEEEQLDFGGIECPTVPGFEQPIQDYCSLLGRNRGIQGHQNSCYLDATLFAMFSFTSIFDCMLYRPPNIDDIPEYGAVQTVLREEIVNPLRKHQFVRADKVMKLRKLLDNLTSVKGLMSEEKDPEELLNSLLSQTLKASPFLEISSGQSAYLYQLFVERDMSRTTHPTVQELFEKSFLTSEIKLKQVPPVLILQMPRYGRQFKVFERILPSQLLDVTDVIEDCKLIFPTIYNSQY